MTLIELTEKVAKKFEPIYKRVNGGIFGLLGLILSVASNGIAWLLYNAVEPMTFSTHWISNLGGKVTNGGLPPNNSNIVFAAGLVITGVLTLFYIMYILNLFFAGQQKQKWLVLAFVVSGILALVGVLVVAFFDMKSSPQIHVVGATTFFFGGLLLMLTYGLAALFNDDFAKWQGIISLVLGGLGSVFLFTFVPELIAGQNLFEITLSTVDTAEMGVIRFWEWMWLFAFYGWLFASSLYTMKKAKGG